MENFEIYFWLETFNYYPMENKTLIIKENNGKKLFFKYFGKVPQVNMELIFLIFLETSRKQPSFPQIEHALRVS